MRVAVGDKRSAPDAPTKHDTPPNTASKAPRTSLPVTIALSHHTASTACTACGSVCGSEPIPGLLKAHTACPLCGPHAPHAAAYAAAPPQSTHDNLLALATPLAGKEQQKRPHDRQGGKQAAVIPPSLKGVTTPPLTFNSGTNPAATGAVPRARQSASEKAAAAGTQFTCFTSTSVRMLTPPELQQQCAPLQRLY
jgi:hypothetical protein